jgi:hypothetical protein
MASAAARKIRSILSEKGILYPTAACKSKRRALAVLATTPESLAVYDDGHEQSEDDA